MYKLRYGFIGLGMLLSLATTANAGVSIGIGIGIPNVSIGINLPLYPELVPVPGYPVYYAPRVSGNYFFYDGMYWVYQDDDWYASSWYNGPWSLVDPFVVPVYLLRVPVSYYRQPPAYFRGWHSNAPPRWGQRWGNSWEQRRGGWDRWNRSEVPRRAPLPTYQREYRGDRYPRGDQQHRLHNKSYRYQPRDKVVRQHLQQVNHRSPAPDQRGREQRHEVRTPQGQGNHQRQAPMHTAPQQRGPANEQRQQPAVQREQRAPQGFEQQRGREPHRAQELRSQERGGGQDRGGEKDRGGWQDRGQGNKDEGRGR